jgi:hypothetical protein
VNTEKIEGKGIFPKFPVFTGNTPRTQEAYFYKQ